MGVSEIIVIVACVFIVTGVIIGSIVRKKHGKHSCGFYCDGDCSHCVSRSENRTEKR